MVFLMKRSIICFFIVILFISCSPKEITPPIFDGQRAYSYLVKQVSFGPRVPDTPASAKCRNYFYNYFEKLGLKVDSQVFTFYDPYSQSEKTLVNVIASFKSKKKPQELGIVLMAHYDSRPRADYASDPKLKNKPIDGANDGASGVAVLMELANLFKQSPPPYNVDLVLDDGEDWGKVGDDNLYCLGAQHFAKGNIRDKYRFGILLDMVGDSGQQIYREAYSENYHKELNDMIWKAAADLGIKTFHNSVKYTVIDDHLYLNSAGVPAIDIIDFDYPYWHTEFDTSDKCSARSLKNVGEVVAKVIYNPLLWPKK